MGVLIVICSLILAAVVVMLISAPLRAAQPGGDDAQLAAGGAQDRNAPGEGRDELEAAREAKYREIRDAELDYRTGKLSSADYSAIDDQLRIEALAILDQLESLADPTGEDPADAS